MTPGKISIGDARAIARTRQCAMVVVFGIDADGQQFHVTTYGMTKKFCRLAASFGEQFAQAIFNGTVAAPAEEPVHLPETPTSATGRRHPPEESTP
jgi:hypothetical protein